MRKVKLNNGMYTVIDDRDFAMLNRFRWHYDMGYAVSFKSSEKIRMHRLILNTPEGIFTDHINGNKLDNRRSNLRIANKSQNNCNRVKTSKTRCSSRYKGVDFFKQRNKWRTRITLLNKVYVIGFYSDEREAAIAYDISAKKIHGEFARTNKMLGLL